MGSPTPFVVDLERCRATQRRAMQRGRIKSWPTSFPLWTLDRAVQALRRWAAAHDGLAPTKADWNTGTDDHPSARKVGELAAATRPPRRRIHVRCDRCTCEYGANHWANVTTGQEVCEGCFDCTGECPHGSSYDLDGPSDWAFALGLAGLEPRRSGDQGATAAGTKPGRNRQMVTGNVTRLEPGNREFRGGGAPPR